MPNTADPTEDQSTVKFVIRQANFDLVLRAALAGRDAVPSAEIPRLIRRVQSFADAWFGDVQATEVDVQLAKEEGLMTFFG